MTFDNETLQMIGVVMAVAISVAYAVSRLLHHIRSSRSNDCTDSSGSCGQCPLINNCNKPSHKPKKPGSDCCH